MLLDLRGSRLTSLWSAVCQQVLPGPEAAARAAAAATHKARPAAEKTLAQAVANALHLLGTLTLVLPLLSRAPSICCISARTCLTVCGMVHAWGGSGAAGWTLLSTLLSLSCPRFSP